MREYGGVTHVICRGITTGGIIPLPTMSQTAHLLPNKGVCKGVVLGLTPPLSCDILQKFYQLRKGDRLFLHNFCLLI